MELLAGADFAKILKEHGRLPPNDVFEWIRQTGEALAAAHAAGIVHRDLKPENLFLHTTGEGRRVVKLLDFGVARLLDPEATSVTETGAPIGTMRYIAPELLVPGQPVVGPATDIWGVGLITFELLVGSQYWKARRLRALLEEVLRGPIEPPSVRWPFLPRGFDAWFLRSRALDPRARWPFIRDQVAALGPILTG